MNWTRTVCYRIWTRFLWSSILFSQMVQARGENDVRVNTTGGEKKRFTAVITVMGAGQYLPTMCVFKGKREPKDVALPKGWVLQMKDPAWVK